MTGAGDEKAPARAGGGADDGTRRAPAAAASWSALALLALAVFALGVLRYATEIDAPWDESLASINGATYTGGIERAFRRVGYGELKGIPYLYVSPTRIRTAFDAPYLNHPPLFRGAVHLAARAFGATEAGLRLPPVLCTAAAFAVLSALLARRFGLLPGALAALFLLAVPMGWHYGWMASYEPPLLLLGVLAVGLHAGLRARPLAAYSAVYIVFLAATAVDWAGYLLLPALIAYELCLPRGERRLARAYVLFPLGALAFAATVGHIAWATGEGFVEALGGLVDVATSAAGGRPYSAFDPPGFTAGEWLARQGTYWLSYWTYGGAAVAALGFARVLWRRAVRPDEPTAFAFALLLPAALNVVLFRRAAYVHDYWWFSALPFAGFAVADLARTAARAPLVAVAFGLALAAGGVNRTAEIRRAQRVTAFSGPRDLAREMNRYAGPDDFLLTQADLGQAAFYVDAWAARPMTGDFTPELVVTSSAELLKRGEFKASGVVVLLPTHLPASPGAPAAGSELADAAQRAVIAELAPLGNLKVIPRAELLRESPRLAAMLGRGDLAVLTIR